MKKLMDLQHTSNHLAEQIKIQKAETDKLKNRMTAVRNRQRLAKKYLIDSALVKHEQVNMLLIKSKLLYFVIGSVSRISVSQLLD